jgi:peptidyl-prolyl cis-trans isomerase-like 3
MSTNNCCFLAARRVISGWEVLDAMEKVPVGAKDKPVQDIVLERVTIHANPIADMAIQ